MRALLIPLLLLGSGAAFAASGPGAWGTGPGGLAMLLSGTIDAALDSLYANHILVGDTFATDSACVVSLVTNLLTLGALTTGDQDVTLRFAESDANHDLVWDDGDGRFEFADLLYAANLVINGYIDADSTDTDHLVANTTANLPGTVTLAGGSLYNPTNILRLIPVIGKGYVGYDNSTHTLRIRQDSTLASANTNITLSFVEEDGTAHTILYNDGTSRFETAEPLVSISGTGYSALYYTTLGGYNAGLHTGSVYSLYGAGTGGLGVILGTGGDAATISSNVITPSRFSTGLLNLVYGPTFDAATGWTVGSGWTVSGGKATHASGTAALSQAVTSMPLVASSVYELAFTVGDYAAGGGTIAVSCGGTAVLAADSLHDGNYRYTFTATNTSGGLVFTPSTDWTGSLDNVYLYRRAPLTGTGAGVQGRIETKTADYTMTIYDHALIANKPTALTFTLPAVTTASNVQEYEGQEFFIYNIGAGVLTLTCATSDSAYNVVLGKDSIHVGQYSAVRLQASPTSQVFTVAQTHTLRLPSYEQAVVLRPSAATLGPTAPAVTAAGTFGALAFDADNEVVYLNVEMPDDWDAASDPTLKIYWSAEAGDSLEENETVVFVTSLRSRAFDSNELIDGGKAIADTVTYTEADSLAPDLETHVTEMTIDYDDADQPVARGDVLGIQFARSITADNYAGDALVYLWELEYNSNAIRNH